MPNSLGHELANETEASSTMTDNLFVVSCNFYATVRPQVKEYTLQRKSPNLRKLLPDRRVDVVACGRQDGHRSWQNDGASMRTCRSSQLVELHGVEGSTGEYDEHSVPKNNPRFVEAQCRVEAEKRIKDEPMALQIRDDENAALKRDRSQIEAKKILGC
jgi:hypothetical protein